MKSSNKDNSETTGTLPAGNSGELPPPPIVSTLETSFAESLDDALLLFPETPESGSEPLVLKEGTSILGRSAKADLRVSNPDVSREHVRLTRNGDQVTIENLSRYGTLVDGVALEQPEALLPGQVIELTSHVRLRFAQNGAELDEDEGVTLATTPFGGSAGQSRKDSAMSVPSSMREVRSHVSDKAWLRCLFLHAMAATATVAVLLGVRTVSPETSYTYQFLLQRSVCQWATLYAFLLGLSYLSARLVTWLRNRFQLSRLGPDSTDLKSSSLVHRWARYIKRCAPHMTRVQFQDTLKDMTGREEDELYQVYSPVNDVIHMLPLIGFFGTVLGLSRGLYSIFKGAAGGSGSASFGQAIGTAFDTTLLALGCTILLTILQRLLHRRELEVLVTLGDRMDEFWEAEEEEAVTRPRKAQPELPSPFSDIAKGFRTELNATVTSLGRGLNNAATSYGKSLDEHARAAADHLGNSVRAACADAFARMTEDLVARIDIASDQGRVESEKTAEAISAAVVGGLEDLKQSLDNVGEDARSVAAEQAEATAQAISSVNAAISNGLSEIKQVLDSAGQETQQAVSLQSEMVSRAIAESLSRGVKELKTALEETTGSGDGGRASEITDALTRGIQELKEALSEKDASAKGSVMELADVLSSGMAELKDALAQKDASAKGSVVELTDALSSGMAELKAVLTEKDAAASASVSELTRALRDPTELRDVLAGFAREVSTALKEPRKIQLLEVPAQKSGERE